MMSRILVRFTAICILDVLPLALQFALLEDLDSHFLVSPMLPFGSQFHLAESPLAEKFVEDVIVEHFDTL